MTEKKNSLPFIVLIDRLEEEGILQIQETVFPSLLGLSEDGLDFIDIVAVHGSAYFANEFLMLTLVITATAQIVCSICNQKVSYPIVIADFLHTEERGSLSSHYHYGDEIRSALILKLPRFIECNGSCPERKEIEKYLTSSSLPRKSPFADL